MKVIFKSEKRKIIENLGYYGITDVPLLLIRFGKEKIRGYSGNLSTGEIAEIDKSVGIDIMGLYLFHEYGKELRLSLDALHLLKDQITKNIIELNEQQAEKWFKGEDISRTEKWKNESKGFKVIRYKGEFIGSGKLTEDRLSNYLPKERRAKR